jgi:hypothetical protein
MEEWFMSANNYQFIQTRNLFREYLVGYPKELTFTDWLNADDDDKAALLYVNFYSAITLAWYNAVVSRSIVYIDQEDGVSTVLQYLMKNVDKIRKDSNRFNSEYIYRVAYNCIGGLVATHQKAKQRDLCEISNEYTDGDVVVDLWNLIPSIDNDPETEEVREVIWAIISHMGLKAEKVTNSLINNGESLHRTPITSAVYAKDRLADVFVSKAEYAEIVAELRTRLAPYKDVFFSA